MIANRYIPKDERILSEYPILVVFDNGDANFDANELNGRTQLITSAIANQTQSRTRGNGEVRFSDLHIGPLRPANAVRLGRTRTTPPTGQDHANIRAFLTNAFYFSEIATADNVNAPQSAQVVFSHVSLINHSCQPNAALEWNPWLPAGQANPLVIRVAGKATLHALHPIAQGEEITLCYAYDIFYKTAQEREDDLLISHGFVCNCSACVAGTVHHLKSECYWERLWTIRSRLQNITLAQFDLEILDLLEEFIHLLQEEKLTGHWLICT